MSRTARSSLAFAVYLFALALMLVLAPKLFLPLFGLSVDPLWTRITGILVGYLGYYYYRAARAEAVQFMAWTVPARATVLPLLSGLVLAGLAKPTLILFGAGDALGAWWTWRCLRQDAAAKAASTDSVR